MIIRLTVPGKPIAKARPRFYRKGKYVGTYDAQVTESGRWLLSIQNQLTKYRDKLPVEHPISLVVKFYMPVPKSWPKYKKDEVKNGLIHHTKKPDLDNLVKFVKDNLNEVAWKDDSQVYELKAIKQYSFEPETRIIIQTWT